MGGLTLDATYAAMRTGESYRGLLCNAPAWMEQIASRGCLRSGPEERHHRPDLLQDHAPLGNGALDVAHADAALGAAARLEHGDKVPHLLSVPYAQQPHQHALQ